VGNLNPKQVDNLPEPGTYDDGEGLRLVIKATSRRYRFLRFQLAGQCRDMSLGSYRAVSLKVARAEAGIQRRQLIVGDDL
jgi:hypothetical protein